MYTSQFKREAVELVEREGVSVAEAARRLGVDQALLRSWKVKFQAQGDQAFPGAGQRTAIEEEVRQLREENARLKMERDNYNKSDGHLREEVEMRYAFIEEHRDVAVQCAQREAGDVLASGG